MKELHKKATEYIHHIEERDLAVMEFVVNRALNAAENCGCNNCVNHAVNVFKVYNAEGFRQNYRTEDGDEQALMDWIIDNKLQDCFS